MKHKSFFWVMMILMSAFIIYTITATTLISLLYFMRSNTVPKTSIAMDKAILNNTASLLEIYSSGGLCPDGICNSKQVIYRGGEVRVNGKAVQVGYKFTSEMINNLSTVIESTDFNALRSIPFRGTCPTAYDGQEVIYTFYTFHGPEKVSSCTTEIDYNSELFKAVENIQRAISLN